mmetsp:Transcript_15648/g.32055  ORF Transcript_15648/g.32055 Transcript_15648/m.32055 type:complete len:217 (+) Transcript_15648:170-820(+)
MPSKLTGSSRIVFISNEKNGVQGQVHPKGQALHSETPCTRDLDCTGCHDHPTDNAWVGWSQEPSLSTQTFSKSDTTLTQSSTWSCDRKDKINLSITHNTGSQWQTQVLAVHVMLGSQAVLHKLCAKHNEQQAYVPGFPLQVSSGAITSLGFNGSRPKGMTSFAIIISDLVYLGESASTDNLSETFLVLCLIPLDRSLHHACHHVLVTTLLLLLLLA